MIDLTCITDLLQLFTDLIPRIRKIDPDEGGIRTSPNVWKDTTVTELTSGWWIEWPILHNFEIIKTRTQVVDLRPQSVKTKCGQSIVVSGCLRYKVRTPRLAILNCLDYDKNVQTTALGIIFDYVSEHRLEDIKWNELKEAILAGVKTASRGWGLEIEEVKLSDFGDALNYRVLMNEFFFKAVE